MPAPHPEPCTSGRELGLDGVPGDRERLVQLRGVATASLCDVVAPSPTSADDLRGLADHLRGDDSALDDVLAERGHEGDLVVLGTTQDDRGLAGARLDPVREIEQ